MDDARRVRGTEPSCDPARDLERLAHWHRPFATEPRLEGLARVQGHRQEEVPLLALADLVDAAHVRVVERTHGAPLASEALAGAGLEALLGQRELERDGASEARILRPVDDAHPAGGERL